MPSIESTQTTVTLEHNGLSDLVEDSYLASPLQAGMLFHSLCTPQQPMYVRQIVLVLREAVNVPALTRAWKFVFERHPILRSSLRWHNLADPLQEVHANLALPFEQHDWRTIASDEREDRLREFLWQEKRAGFDMSKPPLMRLKLIQLEDADFRLIWTFHH